MLLEYWRQWHPTRLKRLWIRPRGFIDRLYTLGFVTTLELISNRAQGQGETIFAGTIVKTCDALSGLRSGSPISIATLNYDGLVHAGFLRCLGTRAISDLSAGYGSTVWQPDGKTRLTANPL